MTSRRRISYIVLTVAVMGCLASQAGADTKADAQWLIKLAKTPGKLCVVVGSGGGELAVELARAGGFLVQGLESDAKLVDQAKAYIHSKGFYGLVSVQQRPAGKLPYAENLVSLLIADDVRRVPVDMGEVMRVLAPRGVALIGQKSGGDAKAMTAKELQRLAADAGVKDFKIVSDDGPWLRIVKPVPAGMDGWTHKRYSASSNLVSNDRLAGPPRRVRWIIGISGAGGGLVSANGRNFYGGLQARDSYNGLVLWQRQLKMGRVTPVTDGERVYAVNGDKLIALDAATGETILTYKHVGRPLTKIVHADGVLLAIGHDAIWARDAKTGDHLWKQRASLPWCVTVGGGAVHYVDGAARRGEFVKLTARDLRTGKQRWQRTVPRHRRDPLTYKWLTQVAGSSYRNGYLAFEVSSFTDLVEPNAIHMLSAKDGELLWSKDYKPHGTHAKQARAFFGEKMLWLVENKKILGVDVATGDVLKEFKGGRGHCYPPVATENFVFSGEMSVTNLRTGELVENRITKGACGRNTGVIPANGLTYTFPKSCVCWPMLKGFVALAPAKPDAGKVKEQAPDTFVVERGPAKAPASPKVTKAGAEWPGYRYDASRSGASPADAPTELEVLWRKRITRRRYKQPSDWRYNPFSPGKVSAPVVAAGLVIAATPDQHQVVAVDAVSGEVKWRFTANGRVDTPPTITAGRCLFGTRSGWVYCLRVNDGGLLWRGRAAGGDEQIVASGQIESPWPVAGSVLVIGDTAYFAAGRQYLADGGVRVHAVDIETGGSQWVSRITTIGEHKYYRAAALEFDNYDLMFQEGDGVSMSRWTMDAKTGQVSVDTKSGFYRTGPNGVMAPRGCWSYGPRMGRGYDRRTKRPLVVFRDNMLLSCTPDRTGLFRRDFSAEDLKAFDTEWWDFRLKKKFEDRGEAFSRTDRLAKGAKWTVEKVTGAPIAAMLLAGDKAVIADEKGELRIVSIADGEVLGQARLPAPPIWDGLAVAGGRLYAALTDGAIVCLGKK